MFIIFYIVGAIITAGAIGGIRDEMDGIADLFCVVFWPIYITAKIVYKICTGLYKLGKLFK